MPVMHKHKFADRGDCTKPSWGGGGTEWLGTPLQTGWKGFARYIQPSRAPFRAETTAMRPEKAKELL